VRRILGLVLLPLLVRRPLRILLRLTLLLGDDVIKPEHVLGWKSELLLNSNVMESEVGFVSLVVFLWNRFVVKACFNGEDLLLRSNSIELQLSGGLHLSHLLLASALIAEDTTTSSWLSSEG